MELKEIQDLIKFVAKSGVSEVELESKGFKLVIKTNSASEQRAMMDQPAIIHAPVQMAAPAVQTVVEAPKAVAVEAPKATPPAGGAKDTSNYITVKSPMIGTFYRSSSPDKPSFVNVGDEIKPGKVLCIIEAMKLFNEIESEVSGRIVQVLANDSTPVEYDQPLFLIEPM
jgi:acetyl-CoA carboxylase biotin carboxyl carrier protein